MKRTLILLLMLGIVASFAQAQTNLQKGEPPVAALITLSPPDENGLVTISGGNGAVFPGAQVAIRNLYTEETVYVSANINGAFTASIYGPGNTPFWISPSVSIPRELRNRPVLMPGGPGTILYGTTIDTTSDPGSITALIVDGDIDDWAAYPQAMLGDGYYGLINNDSLYLALIEAIPEGETVTLTIMLDDVTYALAFDPSLPQTALLYQISPTEAELGTVAIAAAHADSLLEVRVPLSSIVETIETASFNGVQIGEEDEQFIQERLPIYDEIDGIVYPGGSLSGEMTRFNISGPLAQGASTWNAVGRLEDVDAEPGDTLILEMDVTLSAPDFPESLVGLDLIGNIMLQPVTIGEAGEQNIAAQFTNNGWSNVLTPSGLAVDNLQGDMFWGSVRVPFTQVIRTGDNLQAGFRFELDIPDDLPAGLYVPTFEGQAQVGDGEIFAWEDNGVLGEGPGLARHHLTRLPIVMNIGAVEDVQLLLTLLMDYPSDGARGILPQEVREQAALSNRVQFNPPSYILSPGVYPLEPYILSQLPNADDTIAPPLLPLLFPGGRLNATVTLPDGTVDELADASIIQNRVSMSVVDDRALFGSQTPLDVFQVSTGSTPYSNYNFDQYGAYEIELNGVLEDIYGNRYMGGGTYELVIAEPLDLLPGVLPGVPFEVGDSFFAGGRVLPGVPATIDVSVMVYPFDGEVIEQRFEGLQANEQGYFWSDDVVFVFDQPGEYVIDYEARFTDESGRLWASSQRSAGIVALPDESGGVAHGGRGTNQAADYRPAWYVLGTYLPDLDGDQPVQVYFPYHSGDIVIVPDDVNRSIRPLIQVQDLTGSYADWLSGTIPEYQSSYGETLEELIASDALPIIPVLGGPESDYSVALRPDFMVNQAYSYISAVRPDVTVRQFVVGGDETTLPLGWNGDDPFNQQIGAGYGGNRVGDYVFLFGGAVIRNPEAALNLAMPYAALAVVQDEDSETSVFPPYRGGPDGESVDLFFVPTGVRPGQVMTLGDPMIVTGHAAPPLPSVVEVKIVSPSGTEYAFAMQSNGVGYFYAPDQIITTDEVGVWTVELTMQPAGLSSAGMIEPPIPTYTEAFRVYVVPDDHVPLAWTVEGGVDSDFRTGVPFNFGFSIPAEWENVEAFVEVDTPLHRITSESLQRAGNTISYQFNPAQITNQLPSYEADANHAGASASDAVTLTFVITGTDENGQRAIQTRTFTLFHDRLLSFEGTASD